MEREILVAFLVFAGIMVAMGCFTGIVVTWIKSRRNKGFPAPELMHRLDEIADRVNRIETSVDTVALEVERISEGQRFTTRLLADRSGVPAHEDKPRPGGPTTPH